MVIKIIQCKQYFHEKAAKYQISNEIPEVGFDVFAEPFGAQFTPGPNGALLMGVKKTTINILYKWQKK